jgi:hypothetical protein
MQASTKTGNEQLQIIKTSGDIKLKLNNIGLTGAIEAEIKGNDKLPSI